MALFDSPDLLSRTLALLKRPASDEELTSTQLYALLTEAQAHWQIQIAGLFPEVMMSAPELLTTSDAGLTYTLASEPVGPVIVLDGQDGNELRAGSYSDPSADYVPEGQTIRMTRHRARTFSNGLYARYVPVSGTLDGSNPPTLKPVRARILLPPRAAILFAMSGGLRDPAPYVALEANLWAGSGNGDFGVLGLIAKQTSGYSIGGTPPWWTITADLGRVG